MQRNHLRREVPSVRYPIPADRLELLTKLLVVAFKLECQESGATAVDQEDHRSA